MIETYAHVSTTLDAKTEQGGNNFIKKLSIKTQTGFGGAHNASLTNADKKLKKVMTEQQVLV